MAEVSQQDEAQPSTPESDDAADRYRARRRLAAAILLGGLVLVVAWAVTTGFLLWTVRADVTRAEREVRLGRAALQDLQVDVARTHLERAAVPLARARTNLHSFPVRAVAVLPVVRPNLLAVEALVLGAEDVVEAGLAATDVAAEVRDSVESLAPAAGRVPLEPWVQLGPSLRSTAAAVAAAQQRVEAVPEEGLVAQVADARGRFLDLLRPAAAQIERVAIMAEIIPAFMGSDEPRSYFVGAANPAEPRGSGGLIGAWSILVIDDGAFEFGPFNPIQDLPDLNPSPLPAPDPSVGERYARYGGTGVWRNLNMTPDFPIAAQQIEQLYTHIVGDELDGTILVDPYALQTLLDPDDEIEVPGVATVPARQIVRFLVTDAYAEIASPERRKRVLGEVAATAFQRFLGTGVQRDPQAAVERVASAIGDEHVLIHSTDPQVQQGLDRLGIAGAFPTSTGDFLSVVANDGSATKLGAFLERDIAYQVQLRPEGSADAELQVQLSNGVDTAGLPRYVVGPNVGFLQQGVGLFLLSTYCAASCEVTDFPAAGYEDREPILETELGHPVTSSWIALGPGEQTSVTYGWGIADAWEDGDGDGRYQLSYQHQTSIAPVRLAVEVTVPPGFIVEVADGDAVVEDRTVRWERTVDSDEVFELSLRADS